MAGICYQSDVKLLSDEELKTFRAELSDAFQEYTDEDSYWTDDEAEQRYDEIRTEIHRRWEIANPKEAAKQRKYIESIMKITLEVLNPHLEVARQMNAVRLVGGSKVGDLLHLKKPSRYL